MDRTIACTLLHDALVRALEPLIEADGLAADAARDRWRWWC